jgi:exoribonuclease-2
MERFWTLQYLHQNHTTELVCGVFKENMVRAEDLPLVLPVMGAQGLARGERVRVKLGDMDLVSLDIHGSVLERLDAPIDGDTQLLQAGDEQQDDDEISGPIAIAVDVNEAPATAE